MSAGTELDEAWPPARAHLPHDLARCCLCGKLGERRRMVAGRHLSVAAHGRCAAQAFGLAALLTLPPPAAARLAQDLGGAVAQTLVEHSAGRGNFA